MILLPLALLVSCTEEPPVDDSGCDVGIDATFPATAAVDAYYRGAVEFELTDADPTAVLSMAGVSGTSTLNEDQDRVTFTPDAPLTSGADYTATLDYCRGTADIAFQTSDLGAAVDVDAIQGGVYSLNWSNARVVEPEDVGSILLTYLDDVEGRLLFSVQEADANSITMRGAFAAEDGSQDPCSPTIGLPSADFSENPYFQVGPGKTELAVEGISLVIEDLLVSGDFAEDGTWFGGGRLAGVIDTRPLQGLVGDTADTAQDGVCALVSGFGVECVDCPSDGEPFCLVLDVHGLVGERVGDEGLIEVVETPEGCE